MEKLQFADEEYYITSEYLLKLASNAGKLFESSEAHEKRLLLKMALQNLELDGKKVRFIYQKPFDEIANYASRSTLLAKWGAFRTFDLEKAYPNPDLAYQQTQQLLALAN